MRLLKASQSAGILLLVLQRLVAADSANYMNATWPPAHYSWVVTTDGFKNSSHEAEFQIESTSGRFCHDRQIPHGVQPVQFPIEGGKLEFNGAGIDPKNWTVNVLFDNVRALVHGDYFAIAKTDKGWTWNASQKSSSLYCSTGLGSISEVLVGSSNSTATTKKTIPEDLLNGLEATLGIEIIRHDSTPSSDKNITTVIRQCTFIRFTPSDEVKDLGPCGTSLPSSMATPTLAPAPLESDSGGSHDGNFALWATFVIVFGVGAVIAGVAFFYKRRQRRKAKNSGEGDVPMYDAAAARKRQQEEFVPAPEYTAANGGVSLPTYDEATRK